MLRLITAMAHNLPDQYYFQTIKQIAYFLLENMSQLGNLDIGSVHLLLLLFDI